MARLEIYFETMAGTHLSDSVRALRDSGSSDALYDPSLRAADPGDVDDAWFSISRDEAEYERVSYSRWALLFAAFAAEAYANDILYDQCAEQDRAALRWLPTVDKYVRLSQLVTGPVQFTRGREPIQTLKWLFKRRDELVHAAPRGEDLTYRPEDHNPRAAAKCIVAVADAASGLSEDVHAKSILGHVLAERTALLAYGERAAHGLPHFRDPPSDLDLLQNARLRAWS